MPPWLWATQMSSVMGVTCSLDTAWRDEYLADDGAVPVRDDEFVLKLEQREQRAARGGGDGGLFRRGAAYLGRVGRVAAHGDEQAVGKAGRGGHRGISQ